MHSALTRVRSTLVAIGPLTVGLVICVWAVLVWAQLQAPVGDYGIFVSVAERLKAGDTLYVDVWNNRDPLFYFTLATFQWLTPIGGWLLELARLLLVGVAGYSLVRSLGGSPRVAALAGLVGVPFVAISVADPASGIPPGVAIALVSLAVLMRRHYLLAGLLVGYVAFFKITVFPIAAVAFIAAFVVLRPGRSWWRPIAGAAAAVASVVVVLLLRGEFLAYLDSLRLNLLYSSEGQASESRFPFIEHLNRAITPTAQITLMAAVTVVLLAAAASLSRIERRADRIGSAVLWATAWSLVAAIGVLAVTGKWPGHAKLLIIPAVLALILVVGRGPSALRSSRIPAVGAVLGLAVLLGGMPGWQPFMSHLEYARGNLNLQGAVSRDATRILETGPPGSYARVGQGDDPAHAIGLSDWKLACPRFQQYWWESDEVLRSSLDCLPTADVILVTADAAGPVTTPMWDRYMAGVEDLLARDYSCADENGSRVCMRKVGA